MSFWDSYFYRMPTLARFNMCNGTHPSAGSAPTPADPDLGIKKIALDPAESSAIERPKGLLGQARPYEAM